MRAFIDGVLRFGIPPRFYLGIVRPAKGMEKAVILKLNETFEDPAMKGMYGSKEDTNDTEDFFSFVSIPLTSPLSLQWDRKQYKTEQGMIEWDYLYFKLIFKYKKSIKIWLLMYN